MRYIIAFLILALVITSLTGCFETEKDLPEGYKIICSTTGNKYSLEIPYILSGRNQTFRSVNVFNTRTDAIEYAISFEGFRKKPSQNESDKYQWEPCR